jgi:hypothetical protein
MTPSIGAPLDREQSQTKTAPEALATDKWYAPSKMLLLVVLVVDFLRFDVSEWGPAFSAEGGLALITDSALLLLSVGFFAWFFYSVMRNDQPTFGIIYWLALIGFGLQLLVSATSLLAAEPGADLPELAWQAMTLAAARKCKKAAAS